MDRYQGVYVKIILRNKDIIKGYINGKDPQGHLLLKNAHREGSQDKKEALMSIDTTTIKDLEVLELNDTKEKETVLPTPTPPPPQLTAASSFPMHADPAIIYHQYPPQASPLLPRDPAIVSSPDHQLSSMDPAVMFSSQSHLNSPLQRSHHPMVQQLFQSQPTLKPLDPSLLFQQQQQSFQDPAIISVTSSPPPRTQPLFGGKKTNRSVKEVVVFEDYSDFEKGKNGSVKKQDKKTKPKKPTSKVESLEPLKPSIPTSLIPPRVKQSHTPPKTRILTVSGGIPIPAVNSNQMDIAKSMARETGLTQTQLVENGAFGISMMVLKAIGGHRRIQPDNHNAAPVVVILAGPTSMGEFGIAAARHLANRGCQVMISMTEDVYCGASVAQSKQLAKFSGARILYAMEELPDPYTTPVDIIVDALLGSDMLKITPAIKKQMNWANQNKAPILSIEFPSGVNPNDGLASDIHIHPKWTLCLGAPYTGCTSRNVTGELFVADMGLPFVCFEKTIPGFHIPWGNEFVLALEYA